MKKNNDAIKYNSNKHWIKDTLHEEYILLYNSHLGNLQEKIEQKKRTIKYAEKDIKDILQEIESIKLARERAEGGL